MSLFDSLRDLLPGTNRPKRRTPVVAKPKPALPPPEAITIDHAGVPLVVMFERSAKARRVSLRVDQRSGRVRLVAPPRMARDKALGSPTRRRRGSTAACCANRRPCPSGMAPRFPVRHAACRAPSTGPAGHGVARGRRVACRGSCRASAAPPARLAGRRIACADIAAGACQGHGCQPQDHAHQRARHRHAVGQLRAGRTAELRRGSHSRRPRSSTMSWRMRWRISCTPITARNSGARRAACRKRCRRQPRLAAAQRRAIDAAGLGAL